MTMQRKALLSSVAAVALVSVLVIDPIGRYPSAAVAADETFHESRSGNFSAAIDDLSMSQAEPARVASGDHVLDTVVTKIDVGGTARPSADADAGWVTAQVPVSADADPQMVGGLPVAVTPISALGSPQAVEVTVFDESALQVLDADGILMGVAASDPGDEGEDVNIQIDYAAFSALRGPDWGSRLKLVALENCGATSEAATCEIHPIESVNTVNSATLTATITLGADSTQPSVASVSNLGASSAAPNVTIAAVAGAAGPSGDWSATDLAPSSSWTHSGSSGSFNWSYPIDAPNLAPGPVPDLALNYSSAISDGRVPTSNNQAGPLGEGFDMSAGYIERRYVACQADKASNADGAAANAGIISGDLCWKDDNATLVFDGRATELIKTTAGWRPRDLDGTTVTRDSGGRDSSWTLQGADGQKFRFGPEAASDPRNSAWKVRVYGNHPGDECFDQGSTFADKHCDMVWRWNIDTVIDPRGNKMTYSYEKETNRYVPDVQANYGNDAAERVSYTAGGYLSEIAYGMSASSATAPMRIVLNTAGRCLTDLTDGTKLCGSSGTMPSNDAAWPDVPRDLMCGASGSCGVYTPAFYSTKRLSSIQAQVMNSAGTYVPTDTWQLKQRFTAPGSDVEFAGSLVLTLDAVTHTAHGLGVSPDITLPTTQFRYNNQLPNRVDTETDGHDPLLRPRLTSVLTETGGLIDVTYSVPNASECSRNTTSANAEFCYPVRWDANETGNPIQDWFWKYMVSAVVERGASGSGPNGELINGSLAKETHYTYAEAGWAKPEGDPSNSTPTFSQFRGARVVTEYHGAGDPGVDDATVKPARVSTYYRGLGGKPTLDTAEGTFDGSADARALIGRPFSVTEFADGRRLSQTAYRFDVTEEDNGAGKAKSTRVSKATEYEWVYSNAGTTQHRTASETTFNATTQPTSQQFRDLLGTSGDSCVVTTYKSNSIVKTLPETVKTYGSTCASPNKVLSDEANTYTSRGELATHTTKASTDPALNATTTYAYDARGRVISNTDPDGLTTTTTYTETNGLVSKVVTSTPAPGGSGAPFATTSTLNPLTGTTTQTSDLNGLITKGTYDALERVTSVQYPQHNTESLKYEYTTSASGLNSVTTRTLAANGTNRHVKVELFDGLLRPFQTQIESKDAGSGHTSTASARGRLVTHIDYDDAGRTWRQLGPWLAEGAPSATALLPSEAPPAITEYGYDGAGREILERFCEYNGCNPGQEEWKTATSYDGTSTIEIPPAGGIPTKRVLDARGQVAELIEYETADLTMSASQTTRYAYDALNRLMQITGPKKNGASSTASDPRWTYAYDWAGRLTSSSSPDAGSITTSYTKAGKVRSQTDGAGRTLFYSYDSLGRKTALRHGSETGVAQAEWVYDASVSATGQPLRGLLTSSTRIESGLRYTTTTTAHDYAYRPLEVTTSLPTDASLRGLSGKSYTVGYTYTADGQTATTALPAVAGVMGKEIVATTYDDASMPWWSTGGFGWGTYVADSRFTADGKPMGMDLGNTYGAAVTYDWDESTNRLNEIAFDREREDGTELELDYRYDSAGNVLSITDSPTNETASSSAEAQCFQYDGLRRLTAAWTGLDAECSSSKPANYSGTAGPARYLQEYSYDALGRRSEAVSHSALGKTTTTLSYASGSSFRLTEQRATAPGGAVSASTYSWDASGKQTGRTIGGTTTSLTWDAEGELTRTASSETESRNVFDADGNRLLRSDDSGVTVYLAAGMEISSAAGTSTMSATRWYTFAGKTVAYRTSAGLGGVTSVVADHHGTIVASVHNTNWGAGVRRYWSDPYGNARGATAATVNKRGFLGAPVDWEGLTLLQARFYDPSAASFLTTDPLLDPFASAQLNAYQYGHHNPATFSDPSGRMIQNDGGGIYMPPGYVPKTLTEASNLLVKQALTLAKSVVRSSSKAPRPSQQDEARGGGSDSNDSEGESESDGWDGREGQTWDVTFCLVICLGGGPGQVIVGFGFKGGAFADVGGSVGWEVNPPPSGSAEVGVGCQAAVGGGVQVYGSVVATGMEGGGLNSGAGFVVGGGAGCAVFLNIYPK